MDKDLIEIMQKYEELKAYFKKLGSAAVAYSSGVDSTFLLYAAHEALGDKAIAITAKSSLFPGREFEETVAYCRKLGVRHFVVEPDEFKIEGFAQNPPNRCYICKYGLFSMIIDTAKANGMEYVAEGSNLDDLGDYRPGLQAVAELKVKSPLRETGFTKAEIRKCSAALGIPTADKPSFACLASRFPYGELITEEKLGMVEKAEQLLIDMGFKQLRVRIHGRSARIELLPEDITRMLDEELRLKVYTEFKNYGFDYVSLDLKGYRTGSLNEVLK